jgi:histone-arginine methyltransferase CARM1
VYEAEVHSTSQVYSAESNVLLIRVTEGSAVATFASDTDAACVLDYINKELSEGSKVKSSSIFNLRTEEASAKQYFQFYGYLSQQQNMMQVTV